MTAENATSAGIALITKLCNPPLVNTDLQRSTSKPSVLQALATLMSQGL